MIMKGTRTSQKRAIHLMPPMRTSPVAAAMMIPQVMRMGISAVPSGKRSITLLVTALAWNMLPMPKAATTVKRAKRTPSHFMFRPRSRTYIGPPDISPRSFLTRNCTERRASAYLVAMPKTPVIHIQKMAPGPPAVTATATPTMLPAPTVAARAVESAPNGLTSPSALRSGLKVSLIAGQIQRWITPSRKVR